MHSREEEGFYILEGEITFTIDGKRVLATAGTFANMPVGTPHSFKNESRKPARMLISVALAGLEKMFVEVGDGCTNVRHRDQIADAVRRWLLRAACDFQRGISILHYPRPATADAVEFRL
jgi:hypothetical protein